MSYACGASGHALAAARSRLQRAGAAAGRPRAGKRAPRAEATGLRRRRRRRRRRRSAARTRKTLLLRPPRASSALVGPTLDDVPARAVVGLARAVASPRASAEHGSEGHAVAAGLGLLVLLENEV
ncbi:unnamed protein product [Prorocentrum cordatum]|uniref:Uncharacterized protein n=1 Tax=Prorocentrum cordatum TaxID=2364126 RepID=A0ABN9RSI9_9DINO|nr:unnamed protein product [Polarella glacialis]